MKIKNVLFVCMMGLSSVGMAATVGGCGLVGQGMEKYDRLVELDEGANMAFSNIDIQLQRRSDLIPNLVESVKGSALHEHSTLQDVIAARSQAAQIKLSAEDLSDPEKMRAFNEAQKGLSGALSRLMVVSEKYPDLQANQQFHDLNISLEGTENRVMQARRDYNQSVMAYNVELRKVSGQALQVVIGTKTFKPRLPFTADSEARTAPKVSFTTPPSTPPAVSPTLPGTAGNSGVHQ